MTSNARATSRRNTNPRVARCARTSLRRRSNRGSPRHGARLSSASASAIDARFVGVLPSSPPASRFRRSPHVRADQVLPATRRPHQGLRIRRGFERVPSLTDLARERAASRARENLATVRHSLYYAFMRDREQNTFRGVLRLILGQGITPCAHRAGDLFFSDSLRFQSLHQARERDRLADVMYSAQPSCHSLDTHTEAGVRD
jgi:hypothetical protein